MKLHIDRAATLKALLAQEDTDGSKKPPFYTPYLRAFLDAWGDCMSKAWIREHLGIAIDEHERVWMNPATPLTGTGLSRYYGEGKDQPQATEPDHLDNACTSLVCVDLNSMLYRVENDLAAMIDMYFAGEFSCRGRQYSTAYWRNQAEYRRQLMKKYLWNDADGTWYDYNIDTGRQQPFVSASNLLPLWAGSATPHEARRAVASQLPKLLHSGGIASTGPISKTQPGPERQWDAPYGWAPHQIMIWEGLKRYGFEAEARQAAMAWLRMLVRAAVEYNGLITEKFNVEKESHKVDAEYGNVGARFEYVPAGGFGWTNTSFLLGLHYLTDIQKAELDALAEA